MCVMNQIPNDFGMFGIVWVYILDYSWKLFWATMWVQLGNLKKFLTLYNLHI